MNMGTATRINSLLLSQYISARAGVNDPPLRCDLKQNLIFQELLLPERLQVQELINQRL